MKRKRERREGGREGGREREGGRGGVTERREGGMGERREREEVKTNRKTDHYVPTVSLITDQEPKKESTLIETCAKKTKEILKKNPGNYSDKISRLPENLITSVLDC